MLTRSAGEKELTVRLDKQTVQTYYPRLNTLEVIDLQTTSTLPQSLSFWQADPEALARDYEVDLFQAAGLHTLRLVPKDAKAPLQETRIVLRDFHPKNSCRSRKVVPAFSCTLQPSPSIQRSVKRSWISMSQQEPR